MKISSVLVFGIALGGVVGCSAAPPTVPAGDPAAFRPDDSEVRVVLLWEAPVDLDLYVTDPSQESVYFASKKAASGGMLEKDEVCGTAAEGRARSEVVRWRKAPPGRYRVSLDFIDRCGRDHREVGYRLLVDAAGRREERTGTIRLAGFVYRAFEFDVGDRAREESRPR